MQNVHNLNLSVDCIFRTRISQMVVIAMTQKAVENKKNFGTPQYHPPKANKFAGATGQADLHRVN